MRYLAGIPVTVRSDRLDRALASIEAFGRRRVVIDNTEGGIDPAALGVDVLRPPVPLTFTQSMNALFRIATDRNCRVAVGMHDDAEAQGKAAEALLNVVSDLQRSRRRWGVVFTHYDALAAYNMEASADIGPWDTVLPQYFADNDYYRRLRLAGWELIDSGLDVAHKRSWTINSSPARQALNRITFPMYERYYVAKWGGKPGEESFERPFGGPIS